MIDCMNECTSISLANSRSFSVFSEIADVLKPSMVFWCWCFQAPSHDASRMTCFHDSTCSPSSVLEVSHPSRPLITTFCSHQPSLPISILRCLPGAIPPKSRSPCKDDAWGCRCERPGQRRSASIAPCIEVGTCGNCSGPSRVWCRCQRVNVSTPAVPRT